VQFFPVTVEGFDIGWHEDRETVPPTYRVTHVDARIRAVCLGEEEVWASFHVSLTPEERAELQLVWEAVMHRFQGVASMESGEVEPR